MTHGPLIPPQQQLLLYSDDQWEDFVQEWAHDCLKERYAQVQRFTGAGDRGIDIAGFADAQRLLGIWDNYQCKHYDHALRPGDVWVEFSKVIWYSFKGEFRAPRRYYFVAPKGAGTSLSALLANATKLRSDLIGNWKKKVQGEITKTLDVPLKHRLNDAAQRTLWLRPRLTGEPSGSLGHGIPGQSKTLQDPSADAPRTARQGVNKPTNKEKNDDQNTHASTVNL